MKNHLEVLRTQAGLTQQELADRVDVSRQTIISLENGRYNPSILLAFRLSKLFGRPIEEIFIYEEEFDHEKPEHND
ncbi:MAG: helix-turn-helix transcriptional regulator [Chloroflexi bacterium]|nr:helix-turn-helix transcriptional regulator [Chloroflexota bacterium]BCY19451.1 transcriptional regulator [Leptolinea sp. HRD-7]